MSVKAHWVKQVKWLAVIIIGVAFLGCGGGSSSDGTSQQPTDPTMANGIWHGTFTEPPYGTFNLSVLTYDGEIIAMSTDAGAVYHGQYLLNQNALSGSVNGFEIGGGLFASANISATYSEQGTISGNVSTLYLISGERTTSTFNVIFDELFNRPSSLALLEGTWSYTEPGYSVSIDVDDQGEISGSDSDGCVFFGLASVLDPEHNTYGIDVNVTNCFQMNDTYSGLAVLDDEVTPNDTLRYFVSGQNYLLFNFLTRQ
jgi:hypothetical protein